MMRSFKSDFAYKNSIGVQRDENPKSNRLPFRNDVGLLANPLNIFMRRGGWPGEFDHLGQTSDSSAPGKTKATLSSHAKGQGAPESAARAAADGAVSSSDQEARRFVR